MSPLAALSGCFFYRWAGVQARSDSPSVYDLVEAGWVPVAHDTRYGSTLCRIKEQLTRQIAEKDEPVAIDFDRGEASA